MGDAQKPKQHVGRPRRDGSRSDNQRAEILAAAIALFAERGVGGTSMSAIAKRAGLGQSSVYYWFHNKGEILSSLMKVNRVALEHESDRTRSEDNPALRLYLLLYRDTFELCTLPFDYRDLEDAALKHEGEFAGFAEDYERLVETATDDIAWGMELGTFACADARRSAFAAITLDEGMQHRYHHRAICASVMDSLTPESAAHMAAGLTVASLAGSTAMLEARKQARDLLQAEKG